MKIYFNEVSIKAVKKWTGSDGKKHQQTKKFYQTVNPFNKNPDGTVKTREEIFREIVKQRDEWIDEAI